MMRKFLDLISERQCELEYRMTAIDVPPLQDGDPSEIILEEAHVHRDKAIAAISAGECPDSHWNAFERDIIRLKVLVEQI